MRKGSCLLFEKYSLILPSGGTKNSEALLGRKLHKALSSDCVVWALESEFFKGISGKKCKLLLEADEIQVTIHLQVACEMTTKSTENPQLQRENSVLFKGKKPQWEEVHYGWLSTFWHKPCLMLGASFPQIASNIYQLNWDSNWDLILLDCL